MTQRTGLLVLFFGLIFFCSSEEAFAFRQLRLTRPTPTPIGAVVPPKNPLQVTVEASWFDNFGYRPVRFDFKQVTGLAPKDILLRVKFFMSDYSSRESLIEVDRTLVLKAGEEKVSMLLPILQTQPMDLVWWEVEVDGTKDEELSVIRSQALGLGPNQQRGEFQLLKPSNLLPGMPRVGIDAIQTANPRMNQWAHARSELFNDWLFYSSADCTTLTMGQLQDLAKTTPESLAALREWLLTGGMLWIEQVGDQAERLVEIEQLLSLDDWTFLRGPGLADTPISGAEGWRHELLTNKSSNSVQQSLQDAAAGLIRDGLQSALSGVTNEDDISRGWYARYDCGLGHVYAIQENIQKTPLSLRPPQYRTAVDRWHEFGNRQRLGTLPGVGNSDFASLLIPGVGLAPVGLFQLLITLFVLVIGPLNYWLLARNQQLQLLVVTTPLAAALLTVGILAYAFVGDGFGVKVRARSLTLLNQERGEAVSWSRLSHYAGLAPQGGLVFPGDTQIVPILPGWESAIAASDNSARRIVWRDGEQVLEEGWIPTRTAVQHLAIRSRETDRRLAVVEEQNSTEVLNQLGAEIELLHLVDGKGAWWRGEEIGEGATYRLTPTDKSSALAELRIVLLDNKPSLPVGAGQAVGDTLQNFGIRKRAGALRDIGSTQLAGNAMNLFLDRLIGLEGNVALDLSHRSYLAITRSAVETPLGIEGVREVGSFHVVYGRLAEP